MDQSEAAEGCDGTDWTLMLVQPCKLSPVVPGPSVNALLSSQQVHFLPNGTTVNSVLTEQTDETPAGTTDEMFPSSFLLGRTI